MVFLRTLSGVNCGQFWYFGNGKGKEINLHHPGIEWGTSCTRLHHPTNLATCSTHINSVKNKGAESKLSGGREITIISNFL